MKLNDVKTVVQQMVAQTLGESYMEQNGYLTAIPDEKLVDIGKDITDGDFTVEKATKALCSILAKLVVDEGSYKPMFSEIFIDRVEWGGFVERAKIDFADILEDPVFNITDGADYSSIEHKYYAPKVKAKLYNEGAGVMIPISIQRETLTEAFNSWDSLNSYVSKIRAKVQQTLRLALDQYSRALVIASIAISAKATQTAVYLLDDALADGVEGITAETTPEQALANDKYVLYCAKRFSEVRDNMKFNSTVYNNGSLPIACEDSHFWLLNNYVRNLKFDVRSSLFNKDETGFGDYHTIPAWQSCKATSDGKGFTYSASSAVSLSADPTNKLGIGTDAVEISDVIGLMCDTKALGITIFKEYMTNSYTACADFWNEFIHSVTMQILDSDYPIVAFINGRKE